ncbi:MAG TPA: SDR family NAD(P)-dependent oxidoreductase [Ilumatobacteraceae bacterium]
MSRVAVVTGGASGMGMSICTHLARAGCRVAVLDLAGGDAEATAATLRNQGHRALGAQVDVADRASVEQAYALVRSEFGPIEVLVTSAAVSGFVPFEEITLDDWNRTLAVNLTGTFHCVQAAIGDMVAAGWGRIVTISSAAGQTASPRQGHYSASKAGVIGLTRTLAAEYAARGITVNTIPPFVVDTPMLRAAQQAKHVFPTEYLLRAVPAGRLGTGDDIAAACAFLCSDAASYITGQVIAVNGGAVI